MLHPLRLVLAGTLLLSPVPSARAQAPVDLSGHWEGAIDAQGNTLGFELDLFRTDSGDWGGTMNVPSQHLKGLRLLKVGVDGQAVRFFSRRDQPFGGSLSADGRSISGDYSVEGFSLPFTMSRTGEAKVEPPLVSQPIAHALEGSWNGTLQGSGLSLRLVLTMKNQTDGTAIGRVVNLDEGGLEIPVQIIQDGPSVSLQAGIGLGSFSGTLNTAATELVGTWTQGGQSLPLSFRRTEQ